MERVLTEEQLLKLRSRMIKHASISGHPHPEDIAQEYMCRLLEGLHKKATVGQAYVDILRATQANARSKNYQKQLDLHSVRPDSEIEKSSEEQDGLCTDELLDLKFIIESIEDTRVKRIFNMKLNGYNNLEIAEELNLTEGRISQIIMKETENLRESVQGSSRRSSSSEP